MRIAIYDDLHIETDGRQGFELAKADLCVLAGDICVAAHLKPNRTDADARGHKKACERFFQRISETYRHTFYVMGNHEHYRGDFLETPTILRDFLSKWPNIQLLDKEHVVHEGIVFFGATFWTSMNNNNPLTCLHAREYLNDFTVIRYGDGVWTPELSYKEHMWTLGTLQDAKDYARDYGYDKMVVISHHAPSQQSIDPAYKDEVQGNFCYFSDLDYIADDRPIKLWLHGHVHVAFDYYLGDTRVVCNPRGYPYEQRFQTTKFNERKVVEV